MCALAALTAAGPALGGSAEALRYEAKFEYGGKITFLRKETEPPKVARIKIRRMSVNCEDVHVAVTYRIYGNAKVRSDGSFAVHSEDGDGGEAVVRGEFSADLERVDGTARIHGMIELSDGSRVACESGKQPFVALITG
jgi:hypothetical protein